jgi:hypothetical protein
MVPALFVARPQGVTWYPVNSIGNWVATGSDRFTSGLHDYFETRRPLLFRVRGTARMRDDPETGSGPLRHEREATAAKIKNMIMATPSAIAAHSQTARIDFSAFSLTARLSTRPNRIRAMVSIGFQLDRLASRLRTLD